MRALDCYGQPKPLDENMILAAASAVHADPDSVLHFHVGDVRR
jgi:hypothetical protein